MVFKFVLMERRVIWEGRAVVWSTTEEGPGEVKSDCLHILQGPMLRTEEPFQCSHCNVIAQIKNNVRELAVDTKEPFNVLAGQICDYEQPDFETRMVVMMGFIQLPLPFLLSSIVYNIENQYITGPLFIWLFDSPSIYSIWSPLHKILPIGIDQELYSIQIHSSTQGYIDVVLRHRYFTPAEAPNGFVSKPGVTPKFSDHLIVTYIAPFQMLKKEFYIIPSGSHPEVLPEGIDLHLHSIQISSAVHRQIKVVLCHSNPLLLKLPIMASLISSLENRFRIVPKASVKSHRSFCGIPSFKSTMVHIPFLTASNSRMRKFLAIYPGLSGSPMCSMNQADTSSVVFPIKGEVKDCTGVDSPLWMIETSFDVINTNEYSDFLGFEAIIGCRVNVSLIKSSKV
ncbi:hypothetical protein BJ165DRAFT_1583620 [Panaeolus papilionaceus]|nr:hypothetical protein BJ165DRAFT_1583620 [Panaeolus papilionaceus]